MGESIERLILRAVAKGAVSLRYMADGVLLIRKARYIVETHDGVPIDTPGLRKALNDALAK